MTDAREPTAELANLDILRALAVGLVFVDHALETIAQRWGYSVHPYDWYLGRAGVLLFFVHTTYVLMLSLARSNLTGVGLLRDFYIRRVFRIYPLSISIVLAVVLLRIPIDPWTQFEWSGWRNLLSNLALTTNLTHDTHLLSPLWTLPFEMQMYLALPLVFFVVRRFPGVVCASLLWAAAVALELAYLEWWPDTGFAYLNPYFAPCFAAGVFAFVLRDRQTARVSGRWWLLFLCIASAAYLLADGVTPGDHTPYLQWLFCLLIALSLGGFAQCRTPWLTRVAHVIAKYSYGVYMTHCIALWLGVYVFDDAPALMQWLIASSALAGLSYLAYHCIERPMIDMGRRVAPHLGRLLPAA